jgi:two-component system, cell cycle sensor histidine kinase and response regulator CckA
MLVDSQRRLKTAAPPDAAVKGRPAATILVVEDDPLLRAGVTKALQKRGFAVLEADDGAAAMRLILAPLDDIDVVLLDVVIPGVPSRDVLENLRRLRPGVKVILTSTYSKPMVDDAFAGMPVEMFLQKPFQLIELFALLGRALGVGRR